MKNRIGIIGGGQLGRMLTFEAKRLGFHVTVLDPTPKSPAGQIADAQIVADFKDEKAIKKLAQVSDFLTFEIELANSEILDELSKNGVKVNPSAKTLSIIRDKLKQKEFLKKAGIPTAEFKKIFDSNDPKKDPGHGSRILTTCARMTARESLEQAIDEFGFPLVLKARFDGYDGRGNFVIRGERDIDAGLKKLKGRELYIEKFVHFKKELAIMIARNTKGEIASYPVVETIHKNNICHTVFAPARVEKKISNRARKLATEVMQHLRGAGVFGIEMFLTKDGKVYVNEIAPRVHNSGHYTIEACFTSQFEQHIRAITGMSLGETTMIMPHSVMINILGARNGDVDLKGIERALMLPRIYVHIYGKAETKVERKMGHITSIDKTLNGAYNKAKLARKYISI